MFSDAVKGLFISVFVVSTGVKKAYVVNQLRNTQNVNL